MAVSRFTLPATQNTLSQYVSLPLEELTVAAGRKQLQADKNLGDIQGAQGILEKIPVNPWHQPAKDQFINQYRQEVSGLLDQGFDPSSPEFKKQSSNLINRYLSDPQLNTFARGFKTWENEEKTRASLAEEDKYQLYNDLNARIQQQALQTGTNPWVDPTTGKAVEYRQSPIRASSVHTKPVYELFDKMKPSGREAEGFQLDSQGNIIGVKSGYEGLAERFINNVADRNINTFLDTPEGQDFGRKVLASGEIKDLGQLRNAAKDYMRDIGTAYVFHKTEEGTSFKYGPEDVRAGLAQQMAQLNAPTLETEATTNPAAPNVESIDSKGNVVSEYIIRDKNGNVLSKEQTNQILSILPSPNIAEGESITTPDGYTVTLQKDPTKVSEIDTLANLTDEKGNRLFVNKEEAGKAWKQAVENHANTTTLFWKNSKEKAQSLTTESLQNDLANFTGRDLTVVKPKEQGGGSYATRNGWNGISDYIQEQYGSGAKVVGARNAGVSKFNPYGLSGAEVMNVTVKDADDKLKTFDIIVQPTKEVQSIMTPINKIAAPYYAGKVGTTVEQPDPNNPNLKTETTVIPKKQANGQYKFEAKIKVYNNGNALFGGKSISLEEFAQYWKNANIGRLNQYMGSNFLLDKDQE